MTPSFDCGIDICAQQKERQEIIISTFLICPDKCRPICMVSLGHRIPNLCMVIAMSDDYRCDIFDQSSSRPVISLKRETSHTSYHNLYNSHHRLIEFCVDLQQIAHTDRRSTYHAITEAISSGMPIASSYPISS